jgi:nucleoside-diphosphate-sugar epimerase
LPLNSIELVKGDLTDARSLTRALSGADLLVNVASLGFGHAPNIVESAIAAGIKRAVFVSTTAVKTTLNAPTKSIRLAAEDTIRRSGLAYTILRPTMIYGSARDRNICRLIRFLNRWPVIPIVGDGQHLQQPVYVGDVAAAIVQSLEASTAVGQTYDISGAAPVTYNELIDIVCALMHRKVRKVHVPVRPVVGILGALERVRLKLPIRAEQIRRLNEDKAFDHESAARDFGYRPLSVAEGIGLELEEMNLA